MKCITTQTDDRWVSSLRSKVRPIRKVHNLKASKSPPRARSSPLRSKTGLQSDPSIRPAQLFRPNEQIPSGPSLNLIFRPSSEPGRSSAHSPCGTIRMRARGESEAVTHGAAIWFPHTSISTWQGQVAQWRTFCYTSLADKRKYIKREILSSRYKLFSVSRNPCKTLFSGSQIIRKY